MKFFGFFDSFVVILKTNDNHKLKNERNLKKNFESGVT